MGVKKPEIILDEKSENTQELAKNLDAQRLDEQMILLRKEDIK